MSSSNAIPNTTTPAGGPAVGSSSTESSENKFPSSLADKVTEELGKMIGQLAAEVNQISNPEEREQRRLQLIPLLAQQINVVTTIEEKKRESQVAQIVQENIVALLKEWVNLVPKVKDNGLFFPPPDGNKIMKYLQCCISNKNTFIGESARFNFTLVFALMAHLPNSAPRDIIYLQLQHYYKMMTPLERENLVQYWTMF